MHSNKIGRQNISYQDKENSADHWANLIAAVREGKPIVENATYGLRAAGPSLAANASHFGKKIVNWDSQRMEFS